MPTQSSSPECIVIRGARQHNLKNIDLEIPRNRFVVITGVSGSGKSSLAFDTLFAEGQRRYVEALSTYARQFLQKLEPPLVDEIQGLSPAIAIEQKGVSHNPRSTVGTLTEIYDHLRLLFTRFGTVHCPTCGKPIRSHTVAQMIEEMCEDWPEGSRMLVAAPLGSVKEKELPGVLRKLRRDGFARVRLDGKIHDLDPLPLPSRKPVHETEVIVDRLVLDASKTRRLADALELAANRGAGVVRAIRTDGAVKTFSEHFRCTVCGREMTEPSPNLFSFHHPAGACPRCKGVGYLGPLDPGGSKTGDVARSEEPDRTVEGASSPQMPRWRPGESDTPCPLCNGSRLNEAARSVKFGGLGIHETSALSVPRLRDWLSKLDFSPTQGQIAARPVEEILLRLKRMEELGLAYLAMDRAAVTLSGGEAQRIRLVHQIGRPLSGVLYVLDEPSIGLHPRDHQRLLDVLFRLRDAGNSLVVVEHDRETILQADYVVDMGPGAGVMGGEVVFAGTPGELLKHPVSLTGRYLSGEKRIPAPVRRRTPTRGSIRISGAAEHNLKGIAADFPLGCITCVTGVSGSGKSTLVLHTLYRALARRIYGSRVLPGSFEDLDNTEDLRRVILVDQAPIGRTPRSIPATYSGIFGLIRALFSRLPESQARGYGPNRFSFNARGGRCEVCKGEGVQRIEMYFLPDVYVTCPACLGSRYGTDVLEIRYKGRNIAQVLEMTFLEAAGFFENIPPLRHKFETFLEVGLGYLQLGQPATTLSGGEAQRVRLASELSRRGRGNALYILDEPTSGLHFEDIRRLLHVLQRLADLGHTIILIEHHPDVIGAADHVIDLGPEGGEEGGHVVARGTPEEVAMSERSHTGRWLRRLGLGITRGPEPSAPIGTCPGGRWVSSSGP